MSVCWECIIAMVAVVTVLISVIYFINRSNDNAFNKEVEIRKACIDQGNVVISQGWYSSHCVVGKK